jgi:hypothetical protein
VLAAPLPNATRALLLDWYAAEVEVYEYALELHKAQVRWLTNGPEGA